MNLRLALYELAGRHRPGPDAVRTLQRLAGLESEPPLLARRAALGVAVLAAALGGLGIVCWIAANWDDLGRIGRFALLQGLVLATGLGAIRRPGARAPLALLAMLGIGGLFAYFGQTYQTGADPWQLFALWAALSLPLCLAVRNDVVWAPWALVAMVGVSLWIHAHTGHRWRVDPQDLQVYQLGWIAALVLTAALSRAARRWTGAGLWSLRTALTLTTIMITLTALGGLFFQDVAYYYWLGLGLLVIASIALASRDLFDIFGLSAVALGVNVLLVAGFARWLVKNNHGGDAVGPLLILGLVAAGLLAATVSIVIRLARRHAAVQQGEAA